MQIKKSKEHHNKVAEIRKNARIELRQIVKQQNYLCYYCKEKIIAREVLVRKIGKDRILKTNDKVVTFLSKNGNLRTVKIATCEHLIRIADGGGNENGNLVAACWYCNNKESRKYFTRQPKSNRIWKCRDCKREYFDKKRHKRCFNCYIIMKRSERIGNDYY